MAEDNGNDGQEKSFEATETKIRKAREKGDIAQSTELHTLSLYCGLALAMSLVGGPVVIKMHAALTQYLAYPEKIGDALLTSGRTPFELRFVWLPIVVVLPLVIILMTAVIISLVSQRAVVFSPDRIKPKASRLSLISNAKQKYGMDGMAEFGKRALKLTLISVIAGMFLMKILMELSYSSDIAPGAIIPILGQEALTLTLYMMAALAFIVALDLPYVRFSHLKKLRMTRQEVRDEMKDSEGDPHLKQERRARALAMSHSGMIRDVPSADVIIVNPTHYSVALKWDGRSGTVPKCVAKGVDALAFTIRELAEAHNIPIYSDPPCARSLYAVVEIGDTIRPEHYAAVAASIHFANKVRERRKHAL